MYSGAAWTTRSLQSCSSLPRQTSCGSRSRLRRSYATPTGSCSFFCRTDWYSAVGIFFRVASSCLSVSTVLIGIGRSFLGIRLPHTHFFTAGIRRLNLAPGPNLREISIDFFTMQASNESHSVVLDRYSHSILPEPYTIVVTFCMKPFDLGDRR